MKLRDIVNTYHENEWYLAHKKDVDFELNHLELHDADDYVLKLYEKGIKTTANDSNSNVLFLLGITNVEPSDRVECVGGAFPDLDLDFAMHRRDEVFQYLYDKYKEGFAHIGTFSSFKTKNLFKDCLRIFDIPFEEANRISKLLPDNPTDESSIQECLDNIPKFKEVYDNNATIKSAVDFAIHMQGKGAIRQTGLHACGLALSSQPLDDFLPLWSSQDMPATMFDGPTLEKVGIVKYDVLGLKTLSVIENTVRLIESTHGIKIDIDAIEDGDTKAYELIAKGNVLGLFQVEGNMAKFAIASQPISIDDLGAISALYRPGPMSMGYLEKYLNRKRGIEDCIFDIPQYNHLFADTYGLMIYQEGLMNLSKEMSDFTDVEADVLRKAVGKKNLKLLESLKAKMIGRAIDKGIDKNVLEAFWENMLGFASYAFNKSHSISYAVITYQTAWLKAHYPAEFMASLISLEDDIAQSALYIENAKQMGINVLPPDVNQSSRDFTISMGGDILFGFKTVKGIGDKAIDKILGLQPFSSLSDFLIKTSEVRNINKKVYEVLIKCGACDFFGYTRSAMLANFESYIADWNQAKGDSEAEVVMRNAEGRYFNNDEYPEMPLLDILNFEKTLMGIYVSGTPFDIVEQAVQLKGTKTLQELEELTTPTVGSIICQIVEIKKHKAPSGEMAFLTVTDKSSFVSNEFVVFPKQYEKMAASLAKEAFVLISYKLEFRNEKKSYIVEQVSNLNERVGTLARKIAKKTEIYHIDLVTTGIPGAARAKTIHRILGGFISDTPTPYTVNLNCIHGAVVYNFGKYYLKHIDLNVVRAFNSIQDVYVSRGTGTK